jgi:hypothetical protein
MIPTFLQIANTYQYSTPPGEKRGLALFLKRQGKARFAANGRSP